MKKKKILMISPSFDSQGGISTVAKMQYDYMVSEEYNISHLSSIIEGSAIKRNLYTFRSYFKYLKMLFTYRPALVHIHSSCDRSFYRKLYYIFLAKWTRKKYVLHIHPERFYDFYLNSPKYFRKITKRLFLKSEAVIVLSQAIKDNLSKIIPENKIHVLNNPIVSSNFRPGESKKKDMILFLGWIIPEKGVYDILEIIPQVAEKFPEVLFVFCGTKEVEKLRSLCEKPELKNFTDVQGWVEGETKVNILSQSAMLLLPTYSEGFPNVLLEAMASALPIVTTPVGAIPEIMEDGVNGFFISPGDKKAMKEKIMYLLDNPDLGLQMGEANIKLVKEKYDVKIIGKNLEDIYSQVC
jgi:glycosyltransferase involved in cell wall biosynthesis